MADPAPRDVVIFDFDHTLTTFDTGTAFFAWLLKRGTWRMVSLAIISPLLVPLLILRRTRKWLARIAVWIATLGHSHQALDALCEEFADVRVRSGVSIFRQQGLARVRFHLAEGHTVIIATGTLATLATALLRYAELTDVLVIGSSLKTFSFGMIAREHCYGRKKVEMIGHRGFAAPWSAAYTDHKSDFYLLENSSERFLVNPKANAVVAYERKFGVKPIVLHWS